MCNEEAANKDKNSEEDNLPGKLACSSSHFNFDECFSVIFRPDHGVHRRGSPGDTVRGGTSRLHGGVPSGGLGPLPDLGGGELVEQDTRQMANCDA